MANQILPSVMRKLSVTLSLAAAASCLFSSEVARAQTLKVRFPLNDAPGSTTSPSDATTGGVAGSVSMTNSANAAADFHGALNTGVSGLGRALDFSLPAYFTAGAGEGAQAGTGPIADLTSSVLNFGAVNNFTAVIWFKANANMPVSGGNNVLGPRIFTLGNSGTTDKGAANSIGLFYQTTNIVAFTLNALQINAPAFSNFVPTNQWLYYAITYDGTNTVSIYQGSDSSAATLVFNTTATTGVGAGGLAPQTVTFGGAGSTLQLGNRSNGRSRPFDGWLNDFRFYTGAGSANFVEDVRWSDLAPTNVVATTGNDQVNLSWNNLNGAASYNIKVSTTNGGPYTTIATNVSGTGYTDSTALNGTTYYYVVSAVNSAADQTESANSTSVIAALTPPPTVPTITSATPGNAQVIVSWTASTGTPLPITYNFKSSTTPGGPYSVTNLSSTSYTNTGLLNTVPYYYVVSSVSGNGVESDNSTEVTATPVGPPPAPTGVIGTPVADGEISLTWNPATGATSYDIYRSTTLGGTFTNIASGVTNAFYTDNGAADGSLSYFYEVSSVNGSGQGPVTAPLGVPSAFQLEFTFEDSGTNTVDSIGGVTLNLLTNGVLTDYHGSPTSGVAKHGKALDFSGSPLQAGVGPIADVLNSPKLGYGTISTFTVSQWYKQSQLIAGPNNFSPRLFVLGANGATDFGSANSITFKINTETQLQVDVGANGPYSVNLAASLPTNQWLFFAVVYDGTNVNLFTGSETTPATLASSTPASGLSVNFGAAGSLLLGNRSALDRTFAGLIDDFRFYTVADTTAQVEAIRQSAAPVLIGNLYPDGLMLQENTNTLSATITSPNGLNGSGVQLTLNGTLITSNVVVTPGGSATTQLLTYAGLTSNVIYNAVISVTDAAGYSGSAVVNFDTFAVNNFTWEAEEFDYGGGLFIDNPDYTDPNFSADTNSYGGLDSVPLVDTFKNSGNNLSTITDYRDGNGDPTRTQTPLATGELPRPKFLDNSFDTNAMDHMIGDSSSSDWQNYTKTFPAGAYNVYARLAEGSGVAAVTLAQVTGGQGTTTQTLTNLGTFTITGTGFAQFQYIPLRDSLGNLAVVNLVGTNTLRATLSTSININFYMLVPANTNLPIISGVYPDGRTLFEATNKLVFTVSSGVSINTNSILLSLNGTNITGLTFTGGPNTWNVSYPGLQLNQSYAAVISVTDADGNTASSSLNLDTWTPLFQVEAEDFDFSNGQFIDNPVPTAGFAADSYFGQVGNELVDEHTALPHTGASALNYRQSDSIATTPISDTPRQQFLDANVSDYNIGFLGGGFWENYTKTWPAGTYNIYGRMASGNGGFVHTKFDQITAGWGTQDELTTNVGTFTLPASGGYSTYVYVPLIDKYGNYANVTLGGTNTFRTTEDNPVNINFYMLLAARTDLPRIDSIYPDGSTLLEGGTNTFSFLASSTNGIAGTNVQVTLNGVNISSSLVFTGSSTSWQVSYPGLVPNSSYTAAISITDAHNQTAATTVTFDTFSANNFTWEAEDYDFNNGEFIDNPVPSFSSATNSYYNQVGDVGVDENYVNYEGTHIYRPADFMAEEFTSDAPRARFIAARQAAVDPNIQDFDVYDFLNTAWMNYTRTYPVGNFHVYARLSGGNGAFNPTLGQVTSGWGTTAQTVQNLGTFKGTGTSFTTWQYVELVDSTTSQPVTLTLGGTNTFRVTSDGNANVNFFMLLPAAVASPLTATISGGNIVVSFATQMGFNYTISTKNSLTDPTWTPLTTVPGDGTVKTVNDSASLTSRFYRLSVQ